MVLGHDGFEALTYQWYFVNSKVSHQQIPLWTPYLTHGNPAWWFFIYSRMDIFSNLMMLFSAWIKGINFLPLFYRGLFFNKFILLLGTWLLASRCFANPVTVFFVVSTVMASTITMTQTSFTLTLIYGLPLMIYLLHRFFDSRRWFWFFLAFYFFCMISINIYYFVPVFSLSIFLYFFVHYFKSFPELVKDIKLQKNDIVWIVLTIVLFLILFLIVSLFKDPLMYINDSTRLPNGQASLTNFLFYGGNTGFAKLWELILGVSPNLDYTFYMGVLSLPLVALGACFGKNPHKKPFLIGAFFFLMFSSATSISMSAYYCWPLMKYYRHIGFIAPLIKLYLSFLAGFGFEQLFDLNQKGDQKKVFYKCIFSGLFLFIICLFLWYLLLKVGRVSNILHQYSLGTSTVPNILSQQVYSSTVLKVSFLALAGSIAFILWPFVKLYSKGFLILFIILLFHLTDVYTYDFNQVWLRSFSLTKEQYALFNFRPISFVTHRLSAINRTDPREQIVGVLNGTVLDSFNNFTFSDFVKPQRRSDSSLVNIHEFFRVFDKDDRSSVFLKLTGVKEGKIQFFSQAYNVSSHEDIMAFMKDKHYAGDMLFYYGLNKSLGLSLADVKGLDLSQNHRVQIPYQVITYSPNEIILKANILHYPEPWLEYCDSWHPYWKAQINGRAQNIYEGNLSYKALPLKQGMNTIRFYIENNFLMLLYDFFMYSSLVWVLLLIGLLAEAI